MNSPTSPPALPKKLDRVISTSLDASVVCTVVEKDSKPLQHIQLGTDRLVQAGRQQYRPIVAVGYAETASYKPRRV